MKAKKAGARVIVIDPWYNQTAKGTADKWIPIRPGTDTTMLLAIAYEMITNNLQDQAFLDNYTIGFDQDHMPEGAIRRRTSRIMSWAPTTRSPRHLNGLPRSAARIRMRSAAGVGNGNHQARDDHRRTEHREDSRW